jgi:glycosyltransferase involved in cell wall biosynthesis
MEMAVSHPDSLTARETKACKEINNPMTQPLVTIVTPSYNRGEFIRETMDGGSTDETASIVSEYTDRVTFIGERDRGQSHAINKGFKLARGEIVSWLNSDDIILPGVVSRAAEAFQRQPSLGAVYGDGYLIDGNGEIKKRFPATESFNLWKLIYVVDYILQADRVFSARRSRGGRIHQ